MRKLDKVLAIVAGDMLMLDRAPGMAPETVCTCGLAGVLAESQAQIMAASPRHALPRRRTAKHAR
jgi:hypothetical protein